jgi:hypothetical protein
MKTKTYKSEIGPELAISLSGLLLIAIILVIWKGSWGGVVVVTIVAAFILHLFSTACYQIIGDQVRIKSGLLFDKTIPIGSITKIIETRNALSSPALSLNRLLLKYNRFDYILISPEDRPHFIADLLIVSQNIEVQA